MERTHIKSFGGTLRQQGSMLLVLLTALILLTACEMPTPISPASTPLSAPVGQEIAFITHVGGAANNAYAAFQSLHEGEEVNVPQGGSVTIVCQNGYVYRIVDGTTVVITNQRCESGQSLPNDEEQRVAPDQGRIVNNEGSLELEEGARDRESDYGRIPVILDPRNTTLAELTPTITWIGLDDALEYELSLSALAPLPTVVLDAAAVTCQPDERFGATQACSVAWPQDQWPLEPGERYFLTISARLDFAGPLRPSERSALRTLPVDEAEALQSKQTAIEALDIDEVTRSLLAAGTYAKYQLFGDAIRAYEEALALQPVPLVYVTLGDLYRQIELNRYAFEAYQTALDLTDEGQDLSVHAAAEYGIGLVLYSRSNFAEAETHFATALDIYRQAGADEEVAMTETALAKTKKRIP